MEQWCGEKGPPRNNTPDIIKVKELSAAPASEICTISSMAFPEPQIAKIHSSSKDPTIPHGYGKEDQKIYPSLNDLNLPPNPFNNLATMTVISPKAEPHNNKERPPLPVPSEISPLSTPPITNSSVDTRETSFYKGNFYAEKIRGNSLTTSLSPTPPPRKQKQKLSIRMPFPKRWGLSQYMVLEMLLEEKSILGTSRD